jgi:hypothetical protein
MIFTRRMTPAAGLELAERERLVALERDAGERNANRVAPLRHRLDVALLLPEDLPHHAQRFGDLGGAGEGARRREAQRHEACAGENPEDHGLVF